MELIKDEVVIEARSFSSILTRNMIDGIFDFTNGYGEIVKTWLANTVLIHPMLVLSTKKEKSILNP